MDLLLAQIASVARRMWKYRWYGVLAAWVVGLIGSVAVFMVPDRYEASARIYVDTQTILKPLMSGLAVPSNVDQQVAMLSRTLISRPNVEKLVRMADLDLKNKTKAQQEATIDAVSRSLSIQSTGRDNLYTLSYRAEDPETAKRVVQSMVSIFVESSLGASRKDTATAASFINEQIKNYEAKLEEAEARLKAFRLKNIELMAGEGKDSAARISEMNNALERARLELREAENARDTAKRQLAGERGGSELPDLLAGSQGFNTPEIDARIETQRRNLDVLLQRYTEAHPDVVGTRKLIRDLEEQKAKEVANLRAQAARNPVSALSGGGSLAQQEMARTLASTEVQVAALKARVEEYSARYRQAVNALKTAPQLEAEAAQLNRDYAIHKKNYEDLVARRESAAISGELDVASGLADFRTIDPPRANNKPVAPNRMLLLAGALVAALAAGLLTSFIVGQLRPVFLDAGELRLKTQLPVLGVVSRLVTADDRRRQRVDLVRFFAASGGLLGVFALGLAAMAIIISRQAG